MRRLSRFMVLGIALVIAFVLIWRKVHIVIFVRATFWQLLVLYGALAVAVFLILDWVLDRVSGR